MTTIKDLPKNKASIFKDIPVNSNLLTGTHKNLQRLCKTW